MGKDFIFPIVYSFFRLQESKRNRPPKEEIQASIRNNMIGIFQLVIFLKGTGVSTVTWACYCTFYGIFKYRTEY